MGPRGAAQLPWRSKDRAAVHRMADFVALGAIEGSIEASMDAPVPGGAETINLYVNVPQVRQMSRPRMRRRATRKSSRQGQLVTRCKVGLRPERVRWPGTAR